MVLSTAMQSGTRPAESIAGKFFPGLLGGGGAMVIITDGEDTSSRVRFRTVMDRARSEEVMVYAIGLASDYFNGVRQVRSRPDRNVQA